MSHFSNSSSHHGGKDGVQTSKASSSSTTPPLGESLSSTPRSFEVRSSSTLLFPSEQRYEVFLSFRGETRRGFTDHLYKRLDNAKVSVFRDKEGLPLGERNWPKIVKAIETSRISILVISPDYASSEWCLDELIQILKCKETFGQLVIPIFYRVTPSNLRKESYVESQLRKMSIHDIDGTHVQEWKDALIKVSYFTGLESEKIADGYEGDFVEIVVTKVLKALKGLRKPTLYVSDDLVGVDYHAEKIMKMVNVNGSNDVHALLIHGMGGIGKTTLAKVICNQLTHLFDCYSFLANIRETWLQHKGKVELQEQLILDILGEKESILSVDKGIEIIRDKFKNKKVLILLDDVDQRDQLNALAGKRDWFGRGSILIVTSRKKMIDFLWGGSFGYELNELNDHESFLLFCKHAFKKSQSIPNELHTIAKEIVSTAGGLPLAIEVIGSLLYGKNVRFWEEKLKILKEIPEGEVKNKLNISFDALNYEEKQIFLDIACLQIRKALALYMWESCEFYPKLSIENLICMSLIKLRERKELVIHDQLRDFGREIVRQESINNLGERSRLWKSEEAHKVLELKKRTQAVETFYLPNYCGWRLQLRHYYISKQLKVVTRLRYLQMNSVGLREDFKNLFQNGTEKVEALCLTDDSRVRRYIGQRRYTSEQFKGMTELRYLQMSGVNLEGDFENLFQNLRWLKWSYVGLDFIESDFIPKKLVVLELCSVNVIGKWIGWTQMKLLKVLILSKCDTTFPDLSALKELEVLLLDWFCNLIQIHPSIGKLTKLEILSVRNSYFIKCVPDSVGSLVKLRRLELHGCELLTEIPKSIGNLKLLIEIDLRWTGVTQLPDSIGDLCNLESLRLSNTPIRCLPTSIRKLSKLKALDLWDCPQLESLPSLPCSLTSLEFYGKLMETLPNFSNFTNLELLRFKDDFGRRNRALKFSNLNRMQTLRLEHSMVEFGFSDSTINHSHKAHRHPFGEFGSVGHPILKGFGIVTKNINLPLELPSIFSDSTINRRHEAPRHPFREFGSVGRPIFKGFEIVYKNSNLLLELPSNLVELRLMGCYTLRTLPNFSNLKNLSLLSIRSCPELMKMDGLDGATKLKDLEIFDCKNLVEINGLDNAESIQKVSISWCPSLERIGGLSHLKTLTTLELHHCNKLLEIQGLENLRPLT